ncbi:pkaC [Symbiodinium necroappetens]|uniref:PkaC protein n=1 Tax=Symbiodinium necroappetens TaxID=1628268 RepID=A0A812Z9D9_9DINO|nr:pkaC [Symbiodinium necroappetens]
MIGVGAFGSVRLVEHVKTGARYALKRIKKEDGQVPMEIQEECNLLGMASHPFVLQLVRSFQTEKSLYILTELITGGQLYEQMRDKMGTASRRHAQFYTGSLVLILEALHLAGVAYRDLKPVPRLCDFVSVGARVRRVPQKRGLKDYRITHTIFGGSLNYDYSRIDPQTLF